MKKVAFLQSFAVLGLLLGSSVQSSFGSVQDESLTLQSNEVMSHLDSPSRTQESHTLEFGLQAQYLDYKENVPGRPSFKSDERGIVPGFFVGYSFLSRLSPVYLNGSLSYNSSDILYDGSLQDGTPFVGTSGLSISQMNVSGGYFFIRNSSNALSPYAGLNVRKWDRLLDKTSLSPGGSYTEIYASIYIPVGLKWDYFFNDRFHLGVDASLGIPLLSTFRIIFPGRMFSQQDDVTLANTLKTGLYWKLQVPVTYWFSPSFAMTLNPFVESMSYERSYIGTIYATNGQVEIFEPSSRTHQVGTLMKASFKF